MQTTFSSIFILMMLLFLSTDRKNDEILDLRTVETIRVLLFDDHPPANIRINAVDHTIEFKTEDYRSTLSPGDGFAFIRFRDHELVLIINDRTISTQKIEIKNGSGGLTQIFTPDFGNRFYHGDFEIESGNRINRPQIINSVSLERYVASVVGSEMNFTEMEALKSQAVVSRTYALWSIKKSPYTRFDLKDNEQNQVYLGALSSRPDYDEAAKATEGEILTWSDKLILAAFSSTCGGTTSSNENVWSGNSQPYLRSTSDHSMCSISPHYQWSYSLDENRLKEFLRQRYGFNYQSFSIEKDPTGRVQTITFKNSSSNNLSFGGNEFRILINQQFARLGLRSTRFEIEIKNGSLHFSGKGLGHGVGLCQWGAKGFAMAGWKYDDILSFYFSGTNIVDLDSIENQKIVLSQ
jgi:stage II sporulation protein D